MRLTKSQEKILATSGNLIVKASAGTGKTFALVNKIALELDKYDGFKSIAAITFTIKAAQEIRNRITIDVSNHFIGTNNSFAIEEIIKPFMKDVYGEEYDLDLDTDYSQKVSSFQEGLSKILTHNILSSYDNDQRKNFIFELAYKIVNSSKVCQLCLQAKYKKLYIDEYQDCDREMHAFFMFLCDDLNIETFVVGDEKQSIYMWRGAYPEAFLSIWEKENFSTIAMRDNFRSCVEIQNYSNLLCDDTCGLFDISTGGGNSKLILLHTSSSQWQEDVIALFDKTQSAALLRYSNANARNNAKQLSDSGREFVYIPQAPVSDITTNAAWFYMAIACYSIIERYSVYDFVNEIPSEGADNKKTIRFIKKSLDLIINSADKEEFLSGTIKLADYLDCVVLNAHIEKLFQTITDVSYHPAIIQNTSGDLSITFHSSKGLEFDQVVIFAEDYRLSESSGVYNHYVASTRARNKLIIVDNQSYSSKQFISTFSQLISHRNLKMEDVLTEVSMQCLETS